MFFEVEAYEDIPVVNNDTRSFKLPIATLSIENEVASQLDYDEMIRVFASIKSRRVFL